MHILMINFFLFLFCSSSSSSSITESNINEEVCPKQPVHVGVVIDQRLRVGKEQKIAMEMAVQDSRTCVNLILHSTHAASAAIDLVSHNQVDAVIGKVTMQEATLLSEIATSSGSNGIPIISLSPSASPPQQAPLRFSYFIQMGIPIVYQTECIAALVARFKWRKIILLNEQSNAFSEDPGLYARLSESIRGVDSYIDHHVSFPRISSLSDPKAFIGEELRKLRSKNVKVFVVMQSSLDFSTILFEKAKGLGMMGKGFVWIVTGEIVNLLDSIDFSVIRNMQGVIGLKTDYPDNNEHIRDFKSRFRRKYGLEYPEEEENLNPSIYSIRAYDAIQTLIKALQRTSQGKIKPKELVHRILSSDFEGLSGIISFKNGSLSRKPVFRIVNVIGKSYGDVAVWSPEFGFSEDLAVELDSKRTRLSSDLTGELSSVYWPGAQRAVPTGWSVGSKEKPMRIGVPAKKAFEQFVKVTIDRLTNRTQISGFSIEVFEAAIAQLPYDFHYVFVPYYGSYDEMVIAVRNKSLDAAVGDTEIMADRYVYAAFSHPYIESGLVMVVTVKPGLKDSTIIALKPFTAKMWALLAIFSLSTGAIVWFCEWATGNEEFTKESLPKNIGSVLWLSVTIISFSQREDIKSSESRLVLAAWKCMVFVVAASFTAVLSTMMTVPRLQPSIQRIDYLRDTNATVGCNKESFICLYLINVLNFKPENVRGLNSIDEYPTAFDSGEIKAAFFVAPHAKVFLNKYCEGYIISGPSYTLGGFGFVFPKGSPLEADMSEAILKVKQSGQVNKLEHNMLQLSNCTSSSSKQDSDDLTLGPGPFSYLFLALLGTIVVALLTAIVRLGWERIRNLYDLVMNQIYVWASSVLAEWYTILGSRNSKEDNMVQMNAADGRVEPTTVDTQVDSIQPQ